MGALLKSPLFAAAAAALVAWWFLRKRMGCPCPDTVAGTGNVAPPIATNPFVSNPPPPAPSGNIAPPPPVYTLPTPAPPRAADLCTASGGSYGWDPTRGAAFCAYPDSPPPSRTPISVVPNAPPSCSSLGGTTLHDGSCCIPPGCNPNPPPAPPPAISAPPPVPSVWGGYTSDPYGSRTGGGPPAPVTSSPRVKCEKSGGRFTAAGGNGDYCTCPPGSHLSADGFCATDIG